MAAALLLGVGGTLGLAAPTLGLAAGPLLGLAAGTAGLAAGTLGLAAAPMLGLAPPTLGLADVTVGLAGAALGLGGAPAGLAGTLAAALLGGGASVDCMAGGGGRGHPVRHSTCAPRDPLRPTVQTFSGGAILGRLGRELTGKATVNPTLPGGPSRR